MFQLAEHLALPLWHYFGYIYVLYSPQQHGWRTNYNSSSGNNLNIYQKTPSRAHHIKIHFYAEIRNAHLHATEKFKYFLARTAAPPVTACRRHSRVYLFRTGGCISFSRLYFPSRTDAVERKSEQSGALG
jgi:hypothetical protein